MIELRGVHKRFGTDASSVLALRGVDLVVSRGEMCALAGPSGSGKSTVLHLCAGLSAPDEGEVRIDGTDLAELSDAGRTILRRRKIGLVFQASNLLAHLSAYDNVALPLQLDRLTADEERARVERALEVVGLSHRATHRPHELSGGEMQRAAIARAIAIEPSVLLADEPTGSLDTERGRQVIELLRAVNAELGVSVLIVTHDSTWAARCDRVVQLLDGRVCDDAGHSLPAAAAAS